MATMSSPAPAARMAKRRFVVATTFAADVISVPRVREYSALLRGSYDLAPSLRLNSRVMVSQLNSDQRFAGTPVTQTVPGHAGIPAGRRHG